MVKLTINTKLTKMFKFLKLSLFIFSFFFLAKPALAGFGISPADIYNDHLKPGASFEKEIVLSRSDPDEDLKIVIETDLKEAESWFEFEPGREFVFPAGQSRYTLKVKVNIDPQAEIKTYKGVIRIKASSLDSENSGVSIIKGARMEVNLVTTTIDVDTLIIRSTKISDTEWDKPIKLSILAENSGNTKIAPSKVSLEIQSLNKSVIETQEVTKLEKIEPNTTKEIFAEFKNNLDSGEYFGLVKIYNGKNVIYSDRLVFKINSTSVGKDKSEISQKSFFNKVSNLIKENRVEIIAILIISLIPIIIGIAIYKYEKIAFIKNIFLVGTIIYTIIALALLSLYHFKWKTNNFAKPGDEGDVKGEIVEVTPTDTPKVKEESSPLIINKDYDGYPVYRTPDLNSEVIYTAGEDEELQVLSQKDGWYQVSFGQGSGGWLPQSSVKKSN